MASLRVAMTECWRAWVAGCMVIALETHEMTARLGHPRGKWLRKAGVKRTDELMEALMVV